MQPHPCKNSKAGFSRSSSGGFTPLKSKSWREVLISSTGNGMLQYTKKYSLLYFDFMFLEEPSSF